jgi:hypothetical protein
METTGLVIEQLRKAGISPHRTIDSDERLRQAAAEYELQTGRKWSGPKQTGRVVVDEVGLGAAVVDRLAELRYPVSEFNGGSSPSSFSVTDKYLNLRAEAYWTLRCLLEQGQIAIPRDEKLWDELTSIQWKPNSAGRIQIEPKDNFRKRLGRSPDRADAVAMAFHAWHETQDARREYDASQWNTVTR